MGAKMSIWLFSFKRCNKSLVAFTNEKIKATRKRNLDLQGNISDHRISKRAETLHKCSEGL